MKLELVQNLRLEQQLKMSPQLIQRIEILQLASLDLRDLIENELMENEVLEMSEPIEDDVGKEKVEKQKEDEENREIDVNDDSGDEAFEADLQRLEQLAEMNRGSLTHGSRASAGEDDPKLLAMQNTASRPITLQDHLKNQLNLVECDDDIKELVLQIIYNINDRGYLLYPLDEIDIPLGIEFTPEQKEDALSLIQSFDPKGVGARNLQECLLLQLEESHPKYLLMRRLILHYMEDISRNRLPKIAREIGESLQVIQEGIEAVARMDPIPGRTFSTEDIPYINPDVILEMVEGRYEISLEDDYYPKLGVSAAYLRMYRDKSLDPKLRKHIRQKIESAKWLIESIEQRKSTLSKVVHEIVDHQQEFIEYGPKYLKPLKMQEIADIIGIHVSTVSRAISDKYIQTPRGIYSLKSFFTGATRSSDGSVESRVGVRQKVKDIIDGEDKSKPFSDQEIVEKLKEEGLDIARRTVTKYRKALKVPSSRQRRVY